MNPENILDKLERGKRMKKAIIFWVLVMILTAAPAAALEEEAFDISAKGYVSFDEANNLIKAQDNVIIKTGQDEIRADKVVANLETEEIEALGNVILMQGEEVLRGTRLKYNYQQRKGQFYDAESQAEGMYFAGEKINIEQEELSIAESSLTPCEHDEPHYEIRAEKIEVRESGLIIATGVQLWVKDRKIMPLPKYVSHRDPEERKKYAIPEPELGYNSDDGAYLEVNYDHYINENLEGHIFTKVARESTDVVELDYRYQPDAEFSLDTYLDYNRKFGLGGNILLNNQWGSTKSRLEIESFFEEDEDDEEYKEQSTRIDWDLERLGPDLSLKLRRDADDIDQKMDKKLILKDSLDKYYWRIQGSTDSEENYKPEVWLGTKDRTLSPNTDLGANLKLGRIYEPETGVDTIRKQLNLDLKNPKIKVSDKMNLYWQTKYSISDYDTEDIYQTYDLNLGSNYDLLGADLNLDYHYYNTAGETPFIFDQLTDPALGERQYYSLNLKDKWQMNDSLSFDWALNGSKNNYELDNNILSYGLSLGADYQINDYHNLRALYRYQTKEDSDDDLAPIEDDEIDWQNELELSYNFTTNEEEFPYWEIEINTLYNFAVEKEDEYPWQEEKESLEELEFNFTRQFDCFNLEFGFDIPDEGIDLGVDLKY